MSSLPTVMGRKTQVRPGDLRDLGDVEGARGGVQYQRDGPVYTFTPSVRTTTRHAWPRCSTLVGAGQTVGQRDSAFRPYAFMRQMAR